jgi:hypothetical protein
VQLHDPPRDRQPEPTAALGAGAGAVGLLELLEDLLLVGLGDPGTDTTKAPSDARASIEILPVSVNLIALPARFSSTWVSRRSSPRPRGRSSGTIVSRSSFFSAARDCTAETTPWTTSAMA